MSMPKKSARAFWSFPMPYVQVWLFLMSLAAVVVVLVSDKKPSPFSVVGEVFLALLAFGLLLYALAYLKRPWRYRVDDGYLTADRFWAPPTTAIAWADVDRVRKVTLRDCFRNWPEIEVHGRDGSVIQISSNLPGYSELVEVIKQRAMNCQEFEVHPPWSFRRQGEERRRST